MEHTQKEVTLEEKEEEEHAKVEGWKYVLGFSKIAVVKCAIELLFLKKKCAIELGIADAIENHGSPMTLLELSSTLKCDPSFLYRIMSMAALILMESSPVMLIVAWPKFPGSRQWH
ncbi:hypothetical protein M0R45_009826 [Rubus argutus]|uniref:O-methyltransferase dimerisation domain-containing protein n=1 Tax=Rubus argutus TaxID=59490 RepID=A0AAW1Y918_RUBAR